MELTFKVGPPQDFDPDAKAAFLELLKKQGQNDHPSEPAVDACAFLCTVHAGTEMIGIGAIKELYRLGFDYAGLKKLKHDFDAELGYLFVDDAASDGSFRKLGIGKTITRLLLKTLGDENVFATTEYSPENPMLYILKSLGFKRRARVYEGTATGKKMGLMLKFKTL
eukprot:gene14435-18421_t